MEYPDWAEADILSEADRCPLADRLCNQENARVLWEMLRRHRGFEASNILPNKSPEYRYYWSCRTILDQIGRLPSVTPGDYRERAQKIAALAKELASEIAYQADTIGALGKAPAPSWWINDSIMGDLLRPKKTALFGDIDRHFIINTVSGRDFLSISHEADPVNVIGEAQQILDAHNQREMEANSARWEAWRIKWGLTEEQVDDEDFQCSDEAKADYPKETPPPLTNQVLAAEMLFNLSKLTMAGLLNRLADEMGDYQSAEFFVRRPDSEGIAKQVFVRKLHEHHMSKFGQPLWDALALATTISLDLREPLSADDIRPIIKGGRK